MGEEEYGELTTKEKMLLIKNGILPPISPTKEETASLREVLKLNPFLRKLSSEDIDAVEIYGYPVKELALFATVCRDAGLSVAEMRNLADIVKTIYGVARNEFENSLKEALNCGTKKGEEQ